MPTPLSWSLTVAGVDRTSLVSRRTLQWQFTRGNGGQLTCLLQDSKSDATAYRPDLDQEVILTINGTAVFGGFITACSDAPLGGRRGGTGTKITVGSYETVYDRVGVTHTFAGGSTLHDVVSWIVTNVLTPGFGITLDAGMLTGGTFSGPLVFDGSQTVAAIWTQLTSTTGWITRTNASKVLFWFNPGTVSAPITLTQANCTSPIQWQKTRNQYANRVIISYGPSAAVAVSDTVTGDGVTTSWALTYAPATDPVSGFIISAGYVVDPAGSTSYSPLGPFGGGGVWTWRASDNTLHRSTALGLGVQASFSYTAPFPQTVIVEDSADVAAKGPWELKISSPQTTSKTSAIELGTGVLARAKQAPRKLQASTTAGLSLPGDAMTLSFSHRTVSGTWLVESVKGGLYGPGVFRYDYEFLEGTNPQNTWADYLRQLTGGQSAGSTSTILAGTYVAPAMIVLSGPASLGGADVQWRLCNTPTRVPNAQAYDATSALAVTVKGLVSARASQNVKVHLWDGTAGSSAANSGNVACTQTPATFSFGATLTSGHRYWLYVEAVTAGIEATACGQLTSP